MAITLSSKYKSQKFMQIIIHHHFGHRIERQLSSPVITQLPCCSGLVNNAHNIPRFVITNYSQLWHEPLYYINVIIPTRATHSDLCKMQHSRESRLSAAAIEKLVFDTQPCQVGKPQCDVTSFLKRTTSSWQYIYIYISCIVAPFFYSRPRAD